MRPARSVDPYFDAAFDPTATSAPPPDDEPDDFVVRGFVDGRLSVARWRQGRLVADPELVRRVEVVVAMGETFPAPGDPLRPGVASLDGDRGIAMLTVMRAFSRLTSVEIRVD